MVIPRGNEQLWLRFVGKVERLRIGIFRGRCGGNRGKEDKIAEYNLSCIGNEKSKVNSTFCRKEDVFLVDWNLFTKTNSFIRVFVVTICKKDLNICLDPITSSPE